MQELLQIVWIVGWGVLFVMVVDVEYGFQLCQCIVFLMIGIGLVEVVVVLMVVFVGL